MGKYLDIIKQATADLWAQRAAALLAGIADDDRRAGLRYQFEECAAVAEIDWGMSREDAEQTAFEELKQTIEGSR